MGKDDIVVSLQVFPVDVAKTGSTLLSVTSLGFAKRSDFDEYRTQSRGGKGIINVKVTPKNGNVVGVVTVTDDDEIMAVTKKGMMVRCPIKDIRETSRSTQGVRLMNLDNDDVISSVALVAAKEEE